LPDRILTNDISGCAHGAGRLPARASVLSRGQDAYDRSGSEIVHRTISGISA
jgi:hypothetical protein